MTGAPDLSRASRERMEALLDIHPPEDVAAALGVPLEVVEAVHDELHGGRVDVVLRCNRTGRLWRCRSWRRAYFMVCLVGLTDWSWCTAEAWAAHMSAG